MHGIHMYIWDKMCLYVLFSDGALEYGGTDSEDEDVAQKWIASCLVLIEHWMAVLKNIDYTYASSRCSMIIIS